MFVLRGPDELYLQGGGQGWQKESFGWVERVDPVSLEPIKSSPRLPSGGHNWCGAASVHENGDIYVVNGRFCHRLSPELEVVGERELPVDNAHNGHVILSDGYLVTKDIQINPEKHSVFTVMEPDELRIVDQLELPENSVGRFSADRSQGGDFLYVTSPTKIYRLKYKDRKLAVDETWLGSYDLPGQDQTFAWDSCVGSDSVWFHDMGDSSEVSNLLSSYPIGTDTGYDRNRGRMAPRAQAPVRVFRFSVYDSSDRDIFVPFGAPGGRIAAPPLYDQDRRILVAFDSANGKIGAWRFGGPDDYEPLWTQDFRNTNQLTLYADTGELLADDVVVGSGWDAVVLEIETGIEKGRVSTGAMASSGMWYTPGFGRDFYTTNMFGHAARIYVQ